MISTKGNNALKEKNDSNRIPLKLDIDTLDMIVSYLFTDSGFITRGCVASVKKLFDMLDMRLYESDDSLEARVNFIKRVLEAKLQLNMENKSVILNYARSTKHKKIMKELETMIDSFKLSGSEIKYVTTMISDRLKYSYLYVHKDKLYELLEQLELGEFDNFKDLNSRFKNAISSLMNEIRRAESMENDDLTFTLTEGDFEEAVAQIVSNLKMPNNRLACGMQKLNELVSHGFEAGRVYTFLGLSGEIKLPLHIAICE